MKLTKHDQEILKSYSDTIDGLSEYLGSGFEIILHSLENYDSSVIKIKNGFHSQRGIGSPITTLALDMLKKIQQSPNNSFSNCHNYFTTNKKGELLKSSTIAIYGDEKKIIGLLCINFYLDTPISELISTFSANNQEKTIDEYFPVSGEDLIATSIRKVKVIVDSDISITSLNKNKVIISKLNEKGIFKIKDSVSIVAKLLGISKNTVYLHLREDKN